MTICISHNDLDGVVCQYLQAELTPKAQRFYLGYLDLDSWHRCLDQVLESERQEVYFMDLGINSSFKSNGLLKKIQRINEIHLVQWDDHHLWAPEEYDLKRKIKWKIDPKASSAAELVFSRSRPLDPFSRQMVYFAQISDRGSCKRGQTDSVSKSISRLDELLCSGYNPDLVVKQFLDRHLWSSEYEPALMIYRQEKKLALEEMESQMKTISVNGYTIAFGLANRCLFTKPARELLTFQFPTADAWILMFERTRGVTLYSPRINVGRIASALGGGGHDYSGGFQSQEVITPKNRIRIENVILKLLEKSHI